MKVLFHMPTKVIIGKDCIKDNAQLLCSMGNKALIVTGANSAKRCGALDDVISALTAQGREYAVFDKVMANPTIECVYEGAAYAKQQKADFVIAIGGGSPMDAAKAIALLACQEIPEDKLFSGSYEDNVLPMAFLPTTAGTGSEVTPYAVLTNHKAQTKMSISSPLIFPKIAFLDAKYTMALPLSSTINTAIDALSHSIEGMLTVKANPMSDVFALQSIRDILSCFDALRSGNLTFEDREKLLYASMLAGVVIAQTGTTVVHPMGYPLTYFKDVDHGRANGLILGHFLEFVHERNPQRVDQILSHVNLSSARELEDQLVSLLGKKEEVTLTEIEQYADSAIKAKNVQNTCVLLNRDDLVAIYRKSFGYK